MDLYDIETPALVVDRGRLAANIASMCARGRALGVDLRPHMKTAKSADIARLATAGHGGGITVSTLAEAEYFLDAGFRDITYAVCVSPAKLDRAAALTARGAALKLITDSVAVARAIAGHAGSHRVLIEIDCGEHRTGLVPGDPGIAEIAGILAAAPRATLAGVLTHGGHSYACRSIGAIQAVAEAERAAATGTAAALRAAGHPCPVVSVGSPPAARHARGLDGVTEMRPGVYMLGDLFQAGIGSHGLGDIAASVLATATSHHPERNTLMIDAGGIALSKDRATAALPEDRGYGLLADAATGAVIEGVKVVGVHQEHGEIGGPAPLPYAALPIGARVRVLPNHVCMAAAAFDRFHVVDGSAEVVATWSRCGGW